MYTQKQVEDAQEQGF